MATLTEAIKEAYASATDDPVLDTLEFRHPGWVDGMMNPVAIRLVNDLQPLVAFLEASAPLNPGAEVTFQPMPFDFALPDQTENNAVPEIVVAVDNVTSLLMPYLDLAIEDGRPIEVTYRPYLESDLSQPQADPVLTLVIRDIEANQNRVTARATFGDFANKAYPTLLYDDTNWPSLVAQ